MKRKCGSEKKNKFFNPGGIFIAIVGPDAPGKSPFFSERSRWLGETFLVRNVHAGKPPISWITAPFNLLLHLARRFLPQFRTTNRNNRYLSAEANTSRKASRLADLLYAFRAVILAWDRRNVLLKAWRTAAKGDIVICDRYPSNIIGAMDSPRLMDIPRSKGWLSFVQKKLAKLEQRLYAQISPPDLVLRLQVSLETAIERNRLREKAGGEPDQFIKLRHRHSPQWHRTDTDRVFDVDTEQPLSDTLRQVKELVWQSL